MSDDAQAMSRYAKRVFEAPVAGGNSVTHDVYSRGQGKTVVIIQELPGIGPETLLLADEFVAAGFKVVLPHLFGPLGKISMGGNLARVFCMRKEFHLFESNRSSPIVDWLKALCLEEKNNGEGSGVGVIGMCLTGNFALSLMANDSVLAAVSSQPSMPLRSASSLHMSEAEIDALKKRTSATAPMKAYRFEGDWMCSAEKFKAIDERINQGGKHIELNTLPGKGHSVLTLDFVNEAGHPTRQALDDILTYFHGQLSA